MTDVPKRIGDLPPDPAPTAASIFESERGGVSYRLTVGQLQALIGAALALTGLPTAPTPATPITNQSTAVANMAAVQSVLASLGFDNFTTAQAGVNPDLLLATGVYAVTSANPSTYPAGFSGGGALIVGRRNITPYRAIEMLIGEAAGRVWTRNNVSGAAWGAWVEVTRGGVDATITSMTALTSITSAVAFSLPNRVAQFTLTTLPSAATYNGYEIDVTNATGGPKRCRSNGTVWQILNTTTTVS